MAILFKKKRFFMDNMSNVSYVKRFWSVYLKFAISVVISPGKTVRVCSRTPSLQPAQTPPSDGSAVTVTGVPAKNGIVSVGTSSLSS